MTTWARGTPSWRRSAISETSRSSSQVPAADKAKFGKFGVDVNDGFKPYYIVDGDKKRNGQRTKSALKNAG